MSRHKFYPIWRTMMARCYNRRSSGYKKYGERGIGVCAEWIKSPKQFLFWLVKNGYNKGMNIDRIDPSGNYSPENCRIVTPAVNQNNRSNNKIVTLDGRTDTLASLLRWKGVHHRYKIINQRISRDGLSLEEAIKRG